jgi:hypothetical protein
VISGNLSDGIILSSGATDNLIVENIIGADSNGFFPLGNRGNGIQLGRVGGLNTASANIIFDNIISGNHQNGIEVGGFSQANEIVDNLIGVGATGGALSNYKNGVKITTGLNNLIEDNTIAYNCNGVAEESSNNAILTNSIFANKGQGIAIAASEIAAPLLATAKFGSGLFTITGTVSGTPGATYLIQFFANPSTSRDEGEFFLGAITTTIDETGKVKFTTQFSGNEQRYVTATSTQIVSGQPVGTSPFSLPQKIKS